MTAKLVRWVVAQWVSLLPVERVRTPSVDQSGNSEVKESTKIIGTSIRRISDLSRMI